MFTEPSDPALAGTYILVQVDGAVLPSAVPLPSVYGTCVPQVLEGTATLSPQINNRFPLYTILVRAEPRVPPGCTENFGASADLVRDGGRWYGSRSGLRYESQRDAGTYRVTVGDAGGSPTLTATVGGHTLAFTRAWPDGTPMRGLVVEVVDDAGAPVKGAVVAVTQRGLVVVRRVEFGYGVQAIIAREAATASVTPPPNYKFAAGQPSSLDFAATDEPSTTRARIVLTRTP